MPSDTLTFEEAATPDTLSWDDVAAPVPVQPAAREYDYLTPLPPISEAQLAEDKTPLLQRPAVTLLADEESPVGIPRIPAMGKEGTALRTATEFAGGVQEAVLGAAEGMTTRESMIALPAFAVPYVGPGLALGLGAKAGSTGAGEFVAGIEAGEPRAAGRGAGGAGVGSLMLLAGTKGARAHITEPPQTGTLFERAGEAVGERLAVVLPRSLEALGEGPPRPPVPVPPMVPAPTGEAVLPKPVPVEELPNALPVESSTTLPVRETPVAGEAVGEGIRRAEEPAVAEAPRTEPSAEAAAPPEVSLGVDLASAEAPAPTAPAAPGEGAPPGPGAASPSEFSPDRPFTTSVKNAVTATKAEALGLPAVAEAARRKWGTVWDEVQTAVADDPGAPSRLVAELKARPRPASDFEIALLDHHLISLENQKNRIVRLMLDAAETGGDTAIPEYRAQLDLLRDEFQQAFDATKVTGTEQARGLNIRRALFTEQYTLAKMEATKRAELEGRPLTDAELAEVKALHDKIAATEKAHADYVTAAEEKVRKLETQHAIDELKMAAAREAKEDAATSTTRDLNAERANITSGIGERATGPLRDLRPWIRKLALNFVRSGIVERDPLINAVHDVLKDILPAVERRDVMDAISGYGDFRPLDPEAAKAKLRDLTGQMQNVAKLEDLLARRALQKTGPERKVPSAEERRLTKLVNEYKKRYGVTVTDPAAQLKSALDAIKTRLRNAIADLDFQIKTGKKIVRGQTKVQYDAEAAALVAQRDALKARFDEVFGKPELTDEQRIAMAKGALEKSIAEYERRIAAGETRTPKTPSKTPLTAQLQFLRDQRDALRGQLEALRDADVQLQESRAIDALKEAIADMEKRITTGDLTVAKPGRTPTPAEAHYRLLRDQTRRILQDMRERSGMYDADRIAKATKSVDAAIAEAVRQINEGDIEARKPSPRITTPELDAKRAELADLQRVKQKLRNAAKPKRTPEERALAALKARLRSQEADLRDRLARGDFAKRPVKRVDLDPEALRLQHAAEKAKGDFARALDADRFAKLSTPRKVFKVAGEAMDALRSAIITAFDLSAVLRQGKFIVAGHPIRGAQALPAMFRALGSKEATYAIDRNIRARANYPLYEQSGLYLADHGVPLSRMEEAYMGNFIERMESSKYAALRQVIRPSAATQRAYNTFLNKLRADSFDAMAESLSRQRPPTELEAQTLANFINAATGRGSLGRNEGALIGLNRVFFSPRYVASRFQLILGQPLYRGTARTRTLVAREYAQTLIGYAVAFTLVKMALPDSEIETDPRSSDAGKIVIGNTRIDLLAGLQQNTVLLSRLASGETMDISGRVTAIRGEERPPLGTTGYEVLARFLRSKLAPIPGAAVNLVTGENIVGEPVTLGSTAADLTVPLAYQDVLKALEDQGLTRAAALTLLSIFGEGVQVYDEP